MKISELIEKLNEVLNEHGNIVVWIDASNWLHGHNAAPIEKDDIVVSDDRGNDIGVYLMIRK